MDIRSYQMFQVLAQTLHFGRTASHCNLSASAVSRQLQRLESQVGQALVERDNRQVRLTPAGRHFLEYARNAVSEWQQLRSDLDASSASLMGEISVFGSVTATYGLLTRILPNMQENHPGIEVKLRTGDQADAIDRVQQGQDDSAIVAVPHELPARLTCLHLQRTPLRLIGPTAASALTRTLDRYQNRNEEPDWSEIPVVLAERGLARTRFLERMKKLGVTPNIYAQVAGHEAVVSMVSLGLGVAVVPELVIEHSPGQDTVRQLNHLTDLEPFSLGLCAQEERLGDPLLQALWKCAEETFPQSVGG